jgi:hypothetical protein
MSKIQLVLSSSLVLLLVLYLRFFRNRIFNVLFFVAFFFGGIVFVLRPSIAQDIASYFGVGRGVDLVIYFLLTGFFFLFIALFYRTRHLGKVINELVRNRAIEKAKKLGD